MRHTLKVVAVLVALSVTSGSAADWPGIYGPNRNGTS